MKRISLQTRESRVLSPLACPVSLNINPSGKLLYVSYQCGGPGGRPGHDTVDIYDVDSERSVEAIHGLAIVGGHPTFAAEGGDAVLLDGLDACSSPEYDHVGCPTVLSHSFYLWRPSERRVIATLSLPQAASLGALFQQGTRVVFGGPNLQIRDWARQMALETMRSEGESHAADR